MTPDQALFELEWADPDGSLAGKSDPFCEACHWRPNIGHESYCAHGPRVAVVRAELTRLRAQIDAIAAISDEFWDNQPEPDLTEAVLVLWAIAKVLGSQFE